MTFSSQQTNFRKDSAPLDGVLRDTKQDIEYSHSKKLSTSVVPINQNLDKFHTKIIDQSLDISDFETKKQINGFSH